MMKIKQPCFALNDQAIVHECEAEKCLYSNCWEICKFGKNSKILKRWNSEKQIVEGESPQYYQHYKIGGRR